MNITYDYYRVFYYVGKYGSFTKAAQMINSSQPNITRAMNNLESQMKVKLLNRTKRGTSLTYEGEKLFAKISIAFEQIRLAEMEMEHIRNNEEAVCTIGASDIGLHEILIPLLPIIRKRYPKISIRITHESSTTAISNLKEELLDFAITTTPVLDDASLIVKELVDIEEVAIVSDDFDMDSTRSYSLEELIDYPIIMVAPGTATRLFFDNLFAQYGVELNPQMVVGTVNQVVTMVNGGLGVGFLPKSIIEHGPGFAELKLKNSIPKRKICLVYNNKAMLSSGIRSLVECIMEETKKLCDISKKHD